MYGIKLLVGACRHKQRYVENQKKAENCGFYKSDFYSGTDSMRPNIGLGFACSWQW